MVDQLRGRGRELPAAGDVGAGVPGLPDEVRLWTIRADSGLGEEPDLSVLDADERRRLAGFLREADRVRYAVAHVALRGVLGELTGVAPGALRFGRETCPWCGAPHGRPMLASPSGGPEFSLSHGGGLVLIAVARTRVGVDVEPVPADGLVAELAQELHPAEQAAVRAVPEAARAGEFARVWTRKEAYLKGLGVGLGRGLGADDVTSAIPGWQLVDLEPGEGHAGALAVESAHTRGPSPHG
ncbi:4'-phosphopantetheinyl transferase superfamily protein [Streptomyces sp. NPDC050704]|uniref:4'-phosphopantetheinyl transferase family protein n=1 Tax=Streptomyces sp. NPDC050704 TaxID=3157219 RepID=UPI0034140AE3